MLLRRRFEWLIGEKRYKRLVLLILAGLLTISVHSCALDRYYGFPTIYFHHRGFSNIFNVFNLVINLFSMAAVFIIFEWVRIRLVIKDNWKIFDKSLYFTIIYFFAAFFFFYTAKSQRSGIGAGSIGAFMFFPIIFMMEFVKIFYTRPHSDPGNSYFLEYNDAMMMRVYYLIFAIILFLLIYYWQKIWRGLLKKN